MSSSSITRPLCSKRLLCRGSIINYNSIPMRTWYADTNYISCTISNYSDLVNSVWYRLTCTVSNLMLDLLKRADTCYFMLHCHHVDKRNFYVKYGEGDFSVAIPSKQTEYGYFVEVPRKVVCCSRNNYLDKGTPLVIHFHHVGELFVTRRPFAANGRRTRRDEELFSRDMLKLYEMRDSTGDFYIDVLDERFIVHKFVFEARTLVSNLDPNSSSSKQVRIKGDPLVMDKVIRYMYSGVLEEIDITDRLKVLEIAVNLDMPSLVQTLKAIIVMRLSIDSAWDLLDVALKLDLIDLALEAQDFLSRYGPESEEHETEPEKEQSKVSQKSDAKEEHSN